jgi:hypothetical protein
MKNLSKVFFVGATLFLTNLNADYSVNIQQNPNGNPNGTYGRETVNPSNRPLNQDKTMYNRNMEPNDPANDPNRPMYNRENLNRDQLNPSHRTLNEGMNQSQGRLLSDADTKTMYKRDNAVQNADEKITNDIKSALSNDKTLSFSAKNIDIAVKNGKVTLSGEINNDLEKNRVEEIVKNVNGVAFVYNKLHVKHK